MRRRDMISPVASQRPASGAHRDLLRRAARLEDARRANLAAAEARQGGGPPAWEAWKRSVALFHEAFREMYPASFEDRLELLRDGRAGGDDLQWALTFLEADPWCFRSGYVKERLLRYLPRMAWSRRSVTACTPFCCGMSRSVTGSAPSGGRMVPPRADDAGSSTSSNG